MHPSNKLYNYQCMSNFISPMFLILVFTIDCFKVNARHKIIFSCNTEICIQEILKKINLVLHGCLDLIPKGFIHCVWLLSLMSLYFFLLIYFFWK